MGMVEAHARWPWRLHLQLRGSSSFFSVSMPAPMASSFLHRTTCPISRFICPPCFPASTNATAAANPVFLPLLMSSMSLFMRFAGIEYRRVDVEYLRAKHASHPAVAMDPAENRHAK